jgi:hypothetical protein
MKSRLSSLEQCKERDKKTGTPCSKSNKHSDIRDVREGMHGVMPGNPLVNKHTKVVQSKEM